MKVVGYKLTGNSLPIIVQDGAHTYFVKLRAGMCGEYALLSEWLGNQVGRRVGVNTRQPIWLALSDSLQYDDVHIEVRDLIEKSMGVNIGFDYILDAHDCLINELEVIESKHFTDAFLLDVLMLNVDRSIANLNLLRKPDGNIIVSDFESSLLFTDCFHNGKISHNIRILQCLRLNPFYQEVSEKMLNMFVEKLNVVDWKELLADLPDGVLSLQNKVKLQAVIDKRRSSGWGLRDLLERIASISLETTEEKAARIKNNREKLEELVRSTQNEPKLRESR